MGPRRASRVFLCLILSALATTSCTSPTSESCYQTTPGETMRPGDNCLRCHQDGFGDPDAPVWTAAGTVFQAFDSDVCEGVDGVKVFLTAADGSEIELTTNEVGNFWTNRPLMNEGPGPRLEYEGRTIMMGRNLPGVPACNACHSDHPVGGAPGKLFAP